MPFDPLDPGDELSDLQREILRLYDNNPDMGPKEIASRADCSTSYARSTINDHRSGGSGLLGF